MRTSIDDDYFSVSAPPNQETPTTAEQEDNEQLQSEFIKLLRHIENIGILDYVANLLGEGSNNFAFDDNLAIFDSIKDTNVLKINIIGNSSIQPDPRVPGLILNEAHKIYDTLVEFYISNLGFTPILGSPTLPAVTLQKGTSTIHITRSAVGLFHTDYLILTNSSLLHGSGFLAYLNGFLNALSRTGGDLPYSTYVYYQKPKTEFDDKQWATLRHFTKNLEANITPNKLVPTIEQFVRQMSQAQISPMSSKAQNIKYFDCMHLLKHMSFTYKDCEIKIDDTCMLECAETPMTVFFFLFVINAMGFELKNPQSPLYAQLEPYAPHMVHLLNSYGHGVIRGQIYEQVFSLIPATFNLTDPATNFSLYCFANVVSLLCNLSTAYDIDFYSKEVQFVDHSSIPMKQQGYRIPTLLDHLAFSKGISNAAIAKNVRTQRLDALLPISKPVLFNYSNMIANKQAGESTQNLPYVTKQSFDLDPTRHNIPTWPINESDPLDLNKLVIGHAVPSTRGLYNTKSFNPTIISSLGERVNFEQMPQKPIVRIILAKQPILFNVVDSPDYGLSAIHTHNKYGSSEHFSKVKTTCASLRLVRGFLS